MTDINRGRRAPSPPPPFPGSHEKNITWPYWWNAPRPAVRPPELPTYAEKHALDRDHYEMCTAINRAYEMLDQQPEFIRRSVMGTITSLEHTNGAKRANMYLTKTFVERIFPRLDLVNAQYRLEARTLDNVNLFWSFNKLADLGRKETDHLAEDIAQFIALELGVISESSAADNLNDFKTALAMYRRAAEITRGFRQPVPTKGKKNLTLEDMTPVISRMFSPKWWQNRLRRYSAMWREHLRIAFGQVSKKDTPYASKNAVGDWREQKRRTREFLKGMELEDEEGNRISLIEKFDHSVANPAIRRCELMNRIRGFENICEQQGYVGEFYTMTAPSKYHATNKHGHRNPKWEGASPADTQKYLRRTWAAIRAKLARDGISIFGIRVAEPHHDATPHWHMLMFMKPEHVGAVREVMQGYVTKEDEHELVNARARKARFCVEAIDPEKGSATGYIAKYISKNIDGYALDDEIDDETKKPLKDVAASVSAWAARWRIRQFQFIGGAPVTVYRELRMMADHETAIGLSIEFAAVHDAADFGHWDEYVNAQGGPFVRRENLIVRNWYETNEALSPYGEEVIRIRGVYTPLVGIDCPIITRAKQWKIVRKQAVDLGLSGVDLKGAPAPSRSSVNNCTGPGIGPQDDGTGSSMAMPLTIADFKAMTRKERRRALKRIRQETRELRDARRPARADFGVDPEMAARMRDAARTALGFELSLGEIKFLLSGHAMKIGDEYFSGRSDGEIYSAKPPTDPLKRFEKLKRRYGPPPESERAAILRQYFENLKPEDGIDHSQI
ncbi:replication endonuclease [Acerihabitans arboris]|uniref:Replication endonuclease n=1 Tax=Acerihabitans arboris TaxID=2691583 RepID=A0A845SPF3_9GAMM|nr:replication endonuclease [Acerihabitans arboris]NDL64816.1 replication endonuclease [Acerihabitans arboris]